MKSGKSSIVPHCITWILSNTCLAGSMQLTVRVGGILIRSKPAGNGSNN
jgi:hypothetical protein